MSAKKSECKNAIDTNIKQEILICLDETLIALEESFSELTNDQVQKFPIPGENNITWIVMHCLDNLDDCAIGTQSGERLYPSEWRWDLWECSPNERPKPGDLFPTYTHHLPHEFTYPSYMVLKGRPRDQDGLSSVALGINSKLVINRRSICLNPFLELQLVLVVRLMKLIILT